MHVTAALDLCTSWTSNAVSSQVLPTLSDLNFLNKAPSQSLKVVGPAKLKIRDELNWIMGVGNREERMHFQSNTMIKSGVNLSLDNLCFRCCPSSSLSLTELVVV